MALRGRLNQVQRTLILHCGVEGGLSLWPSYHQRPLKRLIDAKNDTYNFAVLPRRAGLGNASNSVTVWGIDKIPPMDVEILRVGKTFLGRTMLPEVSSDLSSTLRSDRLESSRFALGFPRRCPP